jgi:hypothetical protein
MRLTNTVIHLKLNAATGLLPIIAYTLCGFGIVLGIAAGISIGIAAGVELYQIHLSRLSIKAYWRKKGIDTIHDLACWLVVPVEFIIYRLIYILVVK